MTGRGPTMAVMTFVLLTLLSPCTTAAVDGAPLSEYVSPAGIYTYRTSGSSPVDYASEVFGLSGCQGVVWVQSALEGYPLRTVTGLSGCLATGLVIPSSVASISDTAFQDCVCLERLYFLGDRPSMGDSAIPDGVMAFALEGTAGWSPRTGVLDLGEWGDEDSCLSYYVIDGQATIHGLVSGTNITIPSQIYGTPVISIGAEAFMGAGIRSLTMEEGVDTIGVRAFYDCETLMTVELPETLRTVCDEAFRHDVLLADVDLKRIEFIGFESFRMCHSFTEIVIPDTVSRLCGGAFYVCDKAVKVVVGSGVSVVEERAFGYGSALATLIIKGRVAVVGPSAFYACRSLPAISLRYAMEIGAYAFYDAASLESIELGDGLSLIGEGAFWGCGSLKDVRVPDSVISIGRSAFSECSSLSDIHFEGDMPWMGEDVFYGTDVTVHYQKDHGASWQEYDGDKVEDQGSGAEIMIAAVSLTSVALIMLAVRIRKGGRQG